MPNFAFNVVNVSIEQSLFHHNSSRQRRGPIRTRFISFSLPRATRSRQPMVNEEPSSSGNPTELLSCPRRLVPNTNINRSQQSIYSHTTCPYNLIEFTNYRHAFTSYRHGPSLGLTICGYTLQV